MLVFKSPYSRSFSFFLSIFSILEALYFWSLPSSSFGMEFLLLRFSLSLLIWSDPSEPVFISIGFFSPYLPSFSVEGIRAPLLLCPSLISPSDRVKFLTTHLPLFRRCKTGMTSPLTKHKLFFSSFFSLSFSCWDYLWGLFPPLLIPPSK